MKIKTVSRETASRIAAKYGFTPMPKDHPFFSEGPSIVFLSTTQKEQVRKGADSHQKDSQEESATQKKS